MITIAAAGFGAADWVILGVYMAALVGTGIAFARHRPAGSREYFVGDRQMPVWAVAISVLATTLSAATFIGAPVESFKGDLTYLSTNIGSFVALAIIALFFMPAFYRHQVTTVYEILDVRFGGASRRAASGMFMLGRLFASGARLYIAALPLTMILYGDATTRPGAIVVAICVLALASVLYCLVGGIKSIIWTDVIQSVVFLGAAVASALVLLHKIDLPVGEIYRTLADTTTATGGSKLTVLRLTGDLSQPYTLLTAVLGFSLLMTAAYGTDQDLVQRMLTCKSAVKGSQSAITAVLVGLPVTLLFTVIGLLLFVFYAQPGQSPPERADNVFTTFILVHMPTGLKGTMLAGLFAISLTSTMSALNAMSSTVVNDFYKPWFAGRDDRHYLRVGRIGVAAWGVMLAAFASFCAIWQRAGDESLIQFALGVMSFAYSGLLGVYFTALLTRRGNTASTLAALATGFVVVLILTPQVWAWWTGLNGWTKEHWHPFKLAFPWRLFIATGAATFVCMLGSPKPRTAPPA